MGGCHLPKADTAETPSALNLDNEKGQGNPVETTSTTDFVERQV